MAIKVDWENSFVYPPNNYPYCFDSDENFTILGRGLVYVVKASYLIDTRYLIGNGAFINGNHYSVSGIEMCAKARTPPYRVEKNETIGVLICEDKK